MIILHITYYILLLTEVFISNIMEFLMSVRLVTKNLMMILLLLIRKTMVMMPMMMMMLMMIHGGIKRLLFP